LVKVVILHNVVLKLAGKIMKLGKNWKFQILSVDDAHEDYIYKLLHTFFPEIPTPTLLLPTDGFEKPIVKITPRNLYCT